MENFSNNFLLSMPHLKDSIFSDSLIYICNHSIESGAMGIIINKPMPLKNMNNILKEIGLEQLKPKLKIYLGGPVDIEAGMFLHDEKYKIKGTLNISESVSPQVEDGDLDGLIQEVFKAVEDKKSEVDKQIKEKDSKISKKKK